MNKNNVEAFKKYYVNATKEQVIEDMFLDCRYLQNKIDNLRKQNKELKSDIEVLQRVKNFYKRHTLKYYRRCNKANVLIQRHNEDTGYIYYKYDNKFVRSELKERLSEVLNGVGENE